MPVYHTQTEQKVFDIINEPICGLGYNIVRIKNFHTNSGKNIQVMIERQDEQNVSIIDCEKVFKNISVYLTTKNSKEQEYKLEISSPGVNRPLTRLSDFKKNVGKVIRFTVYEFIEGRRKFTGEILNVTDEDISVKILDTTTSIVVEHSKIEEAFLQYFSNSKK